MLNKSDLFDAKTKILAELVEGHRPTIDKFVKLFELLIEESHMANEDNSGDNLLITQGKIKGFRDILTDLKNHGII